MSWPCLQKMNREYQLIGMWSDSGYSYFQETFKKLEWNYYANHSIIWASSVEGCLLSCQIADGRSKRSWNKLQVKNRGSYSAASLSSTVTSFIVWREPADMNRRAQRHSQSERQDEIITLILYIKSFHVTWSIRSPSPTRLLNTT